MIQEVNQEVNEEVNQEVNQEVNNITGQVNELSVVDQVRGAGKHTGVSSGPIVSVNGRGNQSDAKPETMRDSGTRRDGGEKPRRRSREGNPGSGSESEDELKGLAETAQYQETRPEAIPR